MADGHITINSTIYIRKKGSTNTDVTADIISYSEKGMARDVTFERYMGGAFLPSKEYVKDLSITMSYITTDSSFTTFIDDITTNEINYLQYWYMFKIVLLFNNGTNALGKVYYDSFIINHTHNENEGVIEGTITFKLAPNDHMGISNYYEYTDTISTVNTKITTNDTAKGY